MSTIKRFREFNWSAMEHISLKGATLIEEVEEKLNIVIEKLDNTTIGGAVLSKIGRLPKVGDLVTFENFSLLLNLLKENEFLPFRPSRKPRPESEFPGYAYRLRV